MTRSRARWPTAYLDEPTTPAAEDRATGDVVPRHPGSGPLTPAQYHRARVRVAVDMLTQIVADLETSPPQVRQAACTALAAVVELHSLLHALSPTGGPERPS